MKKKNNNTGEITIDDLAMMVQKGFNANDNKLEELKAEINEVKKELQAEIQELKLDVREIKTNLSKKTDVFDHKNLEFRVEKLEEKFV